MSVNSRNKRLCLTQAKHHTKAAATTTTTKTSSMKLTVVAEVKNYTAFYESRMFMTVSIRTSQWNLSSTGLVILLLQDLL
jgi:hypothetical protein